MMTDRDREKIISRLMKILALAEGGVGGERENAKRFLDAELKRRGLTMQDLDDQTTSLSEFAFKSKTERQLLMQIVAMVINSRSFKCYSEKGKFHVMLTKQQKAEVELFYPIYRAALAKTIKTAVHAFIHKNNIFPEDAPAADSPKASLADQLEVLAMANTLKKTQVHRAVENKTGEGGGDWCP